MLEKYFSPVLPEIFQSKARKCAKTAPIALKSAQSALVPVCFTVLIKKNSLINLKQRCATSGPRATTRSAKLFFVALVDTLIFPHKA